MHCTLTFAKNILCRSLTNFADTISKLSHRKRARYTSCSNLLCCEPVGWGKKGIILSDFSKYSPEISRYWHRCLNFSLAQNTSTKQVLNHFYTRHPRCSPGKTQPAWGTMICLGPPISFLYLRTQRVATYKGWIEYKYQSFYVKWYFYSANINTLNMLAELQIKDVCRHNSIHPLLA